ncbi:MAG: NAD-glutamate dehydrogenase domain-containing protein [Treponemataceae bacterium]
MKSLNDIASRSVLSLEKLVRIEEHIVNTGYMSPERTRTEMERFIIDLGIDEYYFKTTPETEIASHLIALSSSELINAQGGGGTGIQVISERPENAVYIIEDSPEKTIEIEERIEKNYPDCRLESYITRKTNGNQPFRFYIITKPDYPVTTPSDAPRNFESAASGAFLERAVKETVARYQDAWTKMTDMEVPFVSVSSKPESQETRIMIGVKGTSQAALTAFAHLLVKYGVAVRRKYVEPFADKKWITSLYFPKLSDEVIENLKRDINVALILPSGTATALSDAGILSPQVAMYASAAAAFTHQFLSLLTSEYLTLQRALKDQPEARGIVDNLKLNLIKYTYSTHRISAAVVSFPKVVEILFSHFCKRMESGDTAELAELEAYIRKTIEKDVPNAKERTILSYFLTFNKAVQRTNFFKKEKSCAAFRIDPSVVEPVDFPERPFGLFFLIGRDFLGFHMRFRDIARGGVRIVKSRSIDVYAQNIDTIFTENYNLALTQQRKNKDIPEGGAKGTILLNMGSQNAADRAFKDYVDGLLDLLVEQDGKGKTEVREILFLGPDEGSAPLMDWASAYAKIRGYPFWKAFSTGKAPELGGIPHDLYGMTTLGIHEYVLGVLEKNGLKEENVTKMQTGGPDGDLGSNEILVSKDKTIGIVDGSGVLYDPEGLNRKELVRLAKKRVMVQEFDVKLLSKAGFYVSVNDRDIRLPNGEQVSNGEDFRNTFHLSAYSTADLFVPCGGRPGAVNIGNWQRLLDDKGKPKFRFIVEGANLFLTEEARLRLEEHGVVVMKDASTNKGGVTSSSFEVLASLALSDGEYDQSLREEKGVIPPFRKAYVEGTIANIKKNARAEFELLWREGSDRKIPFTTLSNAVSEKINRITDAVRESALADDPEIRKRILTDYTPKQLLDSLGLEKIISRVPKAYLKAIIATKMATDFVYGRGLRANEVDFADYVASLKTERRKGELDQ